MCLFLHSLTDCSMHVLLHCHYYIILFLAHWCHLWHIYLLSSQLCVQHVHNLLNHVELIQHCPTLSVFKNIFQLTVKRCWCFYNLCLGLLRENMGDEISSALPATYFFPLVSSHPTPILLPLFFIYLLYIYFSLFLTSCLFYAKSLFV